MYLPSCVLMPLPFASYIYRIQHLTDHEWKKRFDSVIIFVVVPMRKHRKKNPLSPRCKRMKRSQRLQSARRWIETFEGENVILAYRNRYGVDWLCAIKELQLLGVALDPAYVQKLEQTVGSTTNMNRKRKLEKQAAVEKVHQAGKYSNSDNNFYFIAGHTSGGAPYGITWEQAQRDGLLEDEE
jgi:hypothetical protein